MSDLPSIIPLFPLPNLVLFPGAKVPLHIFEPRYREMVADVGPSHRVIGMMLLKGEWESEYYAYPDIFDVGCAGRISELVHLPDGRSNILLEGLSEFRVRREIRGHSYRQAEVEWIPAPRYALVLDELMMGTLRDLMVRYLGKAGDHVWREILLDPPFGGADLVNFLCFHLDFSPIEKQILLEALDARVERLFDVLAFKIEERKLGPGGFEGTGGTTV